MHGKRKREFLTTDPKEEEDDFGNTHEWGKKRVKMLDVIFVPTVKKQLNMNKVLNTGIQWTWQLEQHIISPLFSC
jgi:hypothetical protein